MAAQYPGYGMSPGFSTADGIDRHVRAAFDHFTKKLGVAPSRMVIFGCSVGTGPGAKLAAALQKEGTPCGCLIMQSPYTSIRDAAAALVGFVAYIIFERRAAPSSPKRCIWRPKSCATRPEGLGPRDAPRECKARPAISPAPRPAPNLPKPCR